MKTLPINNYKIQNENRKQSISFRSVKGSYEVIPRLLERFPKELIEISPEAIYEIDHFEERIPGCLPDQIIKFQAPSPHQYLITKEENQEIPRSATFFSDTIDKAIAMANTIRRFINNAKEITEDMLVLGDEKLRKIVFGESIKVPPPCAPPNIVQLIPPKGLKA